MSADLLRKYKHMESMIQFYDQVKKLFWLNSTLTKQSCKNIINNDIKSLNNITKYWTYGCWCFQMGDFPLRLGNGSPVDGVDK